MGPSRLDRLFCVSAVTIFSLTARLKRTGFKNVSFGLARAIAANRTVVKSKHQFNF